MTARPVWFPLCAIFTICLALTTLAQSTAPPLLSLTVSNGQVIVSWPPFPAADVYDVLSGSDPAAGLTTDPAGTVAGFQYTAPMNAGGGFHQLRVIPLSDEALLTANLLNRIAYGPTPDELERILTGTNAIGPDAYIDEQLAPDLIDEDMDFQPPLTNWTYVTATGVAASSGRLILHMNGAGEVYIDDLVLVEGTVAEAGQNLIANGGFEAVPVLPWCIAGTNAFGPGECGPYIVGSTANYGDVAVSTAVAHTGAASLHFVAHGSGNTSANAFYQQLNIDQSGGTTYTLSFWYLPNPSIENASRTLTVRLSGGTEPGGTAATVSARYGGPAVSASNLHRALEDGTATLADLRAWYILHCVQGRQQLLEVLTQFVENHFVTQHEKTYDWFDRYYDGATTRDYFATAQEWREVTRWRQILSRPDGTFHDLLKVSAESPAMIIYLDTVDSRGDGNRIPNENYGRELLELFCNGVDNGYTQEDIVELSRVWSGWTVDVLDAVDYDNPLGPRSTTLIDPSLGNARSNLLGRWTFRYRSDWHDGAAKTLFPGRTVEARFGAPWAGRDVELVLPARSGDNGIQDGYDVIAHLADLPYTQEFLSVKLCRLLVHDHFVHGVYDYTGPDLSPEYQLIRDCMLAWENSSPKGQIRPVIQIILNSGLFRGHRGVLHKVKTPLEYAVSSLRSLRAARPGGGFTVVTDGYGLTGTGRTTATAPVHRMGGMFLFDREAPDGYAESPEPWISAGTLVERLRFISSFLDGDENCDPVGLLRLKVAPSDWNNAGAVAGYFLSIIYPAVGAANLAQYRDAAVAFLNTDTDGITPSPFASLASGSAYDTRVRGMVSTLLTFQRFQEQ